jgi:divalent metal cation (Fe/Co/Zn/Cd) transporter
METVIQSEHKENKVYNLAFGLAIFTIVYNLAEGIIATWFGYSDETIALFGFGVDSFIEMISGIGIVVMILRIRSHPESPRGQFEVTSLKITGYSFYALVIGLVLSAIATMWLGIAPETTFWGVVVSLISIVVMLVLIYGKIYTGKKLHSDAIIADANCTKVCIYMSCVLLASSGIYYLTNFAYADALGTLGLAWFSYQEGKECFEKAENKACAHEPGHKH